MSFPNVMEKENSPQIYHASGGNSSPRENEALFVYSLSRNISDKEAGLACRVCQCTESDKRGDAALAFLGITSQKLDTHKSNEEENHDGKVVFTDREDKSHPSDDPKRSRVVEFISPNGEVFVCRSDIESGFDHIQDTLIELGCACKNDLALVHYACALKWFVNHGSTVCEICSCVAENVRIEDFKKVMNCLKEYEVLRERTANGEPNPSQVRASSGVDPDAIAAIRRQRLSEISLWFSPHIANHSAPVTQSITEQPSASNIVSEENIAAEHIAIKWAVEGTGILLATGLLTVILAWLIAPHVGKETAKNGLHILLGGLCALTVVIFFRFFVLTRIKYGPARYWAILFVFWFLVFGVWASRTRRAHTT